MSTSPASTTLLLVGGTSEIAVGIAETLARQQSVRVVLAARPSARRHEVQVKLTALGCVVEVVDFEATDLAQSVPLLDAVFSRMQVDVAVVAQGVLPDQDSLEADPLTAVEMCTVNFTSVVVVGLVLAHRMRAQGHGVIVVLSSVAGIRPRAANFLYGSTKAGLDACFTGLREQLRGTGVRVLVVRPGHVYTRMTTGLPAAPFAVPPAKVAEAVVARLSTGNGRVWVPAVLGPVMTVLRVLPAPLFRRLSPAPLSQDPLRPHRAR